MNIGDVIDFISTCDETRLGNVAGALLARMVHKWGKARTLDMVEKLIDAGEKAKVRQ